MTKSYYCILLIKTVNSLALNWFYEYKLLVDIIINYLATKSPLIKYRYCGIHSVSDFKKY